MDYPPRIVMTCKPIPKVRNPIPLELDVIGFGKKCPFFIEAGDNSNVITSGGVQMGYTV